ncbi:MAG: adenosylcobinamide-phosphate synthase CbiB [Thalassobaculales bacterium]
MIETLPAVLAIEAAAGYPAGLQRLIGHPVQWAGALIAALDRRWNRGRARKARGVAALLALLAAVALLTIPPTSAIRALPWGWLIEAALASSLIAQRSLWSHVAAVAAALEAEGLAGGRRTVAMIVGRDPDSLDEAGVSRAAIESLAENFSDGVVAPAFWFALGGLPGIALYKALNTADSMIGHLNERYRDFGWAAARLDDLANLAPARLAGLLIALSGGRPAAAIAAMRRDAPRHRSPNAGWPEAAMAASLGLALAGPRAYGGVVVEDALMGDGRRQADAADIRAALAVYRRACAGLLALAAAAALAMALV